MNAAIAPEILLEAVRLEQLRRAATASLYEFVRQAWHVVEPDIKFVESWHIEVICQHLQAISEGRIKRLLINIPPRHSKSTIVSVMWPCWEWTRDPTQKFLCASYSGTLSTRDNLKARRLVQSAWYRDRWSDKFTLSGDQNAKQRFENDKTGYRIATSVGGTATGEGGSRLILDDPHGAQDAQSSTMRATTLEWFDGVWSTRLNDPKRDAMVVVMQRLHQADVSGHIMTDLDDAWERVIIPAEYDTVRRHSCLGEYDPRDTPGELICPERFGPAEIATLKQQLGTYGASGQLQQNPAPRGGGMIKLAWFADRWRALPAEDRRLRVTQSWDTAKKVSDSNDYSVCTTWIETQTHHFLVDLFRQRVEFPELKRAVTSMAAKWSPSAILIEDAASGTSLIQQLRRDTILPLIPISPHGLAKDVRAAAATPMMEAGRVMLPEEAEWLFDLETELATFPVVVHDDQVDSVTQYLNWAAKPAEIYIG